MRKSLVSLILVQTLTISALQSCSEEEVPLEVNRECVESVEGEFNIKYCHSETNVGYQKEEVFIYDQKNNLLKYYVNRGEDIDCFIDIIHLYLSKGKIKKLFRKKDYYRHQTQFEQADKTLFKERSKL